MASMRDKSEAVAPPAPSASPRGVKAVLKRVRPARQAASPLLDALVRDVRKGRPRANTRLIERAYAIADAAHAGQLRKSGEPFITHPVGVAQIVAGLGLDETTVAAALLHDAVEDTD